MKTIVRKSKLSKSARNRILLAKDVIAQLECGKLVAESGTYVLVNLKAEYLQLFTQSDFESGHDVRDVLKLKAKSCKVCAKGAVLIATIMRFDEMPINGCRLEYMARSTQYESHFTAETMESIELCFEFSTKWHSAFPEPRDRLIAIMRNVIRNKGEFMDPD